MIPRVVIAIRESPDWAGLARDRQAGLPIDPARFAQPREIPSFPADIAALIAKWDMLSKVSFFECRATLCRIATATHNRVAGAQLVTHALAGRVLAALGDAPFLLFYSDDDDWFAPDLQDAVAGVATGTLDAVVFPLGRIAINCFTMSAEGQPVPNAIGPTHRFHYRYHTNNYGLTRRACGRVPLASLIEHQEASTVGEQHGFVDQYINRVVSVTSKTPCSASLLGDILADPDRFRSYVGQYLKALKLLAVPASHRWIAEPLWDTIRLFERVVPRRR